MITFGHIILGSIVAIFAVFMNYPAPPESPILYQWRTMDGKYYEHGDYKIFYKDEAGNGTAGTVLCLHGFPTSSFDWYKIWPSLKRRFKRVIALDFLGLGFSDKPRHYRYSIGEQAHIASEILRISKVHEVHILAHDYGDTVALELLARQLEKKLPSRILSTCLLNGGLFPNKHRPTWLQDALRIPIVGTILSRFANYWTFKIGLSEVFAASRQPSRAELMDFWYLLRLQDGYRVLGNILSYIDERRLQEDRWVGALQKSFPVFMIYGAQDPVNPPPFAQHYRSMVPKPKIEELKDVGHYVQLEAPEEMLMSYSSFLDSLDMDEKV